MKLYDILKNFCFKKFFKIAMPLALLCVSQIGAAQDQSNDIDFPQRLPVIPGGAPR